MVNEILISMMPHHLPEIIGKIRIFPVKGPCDSGGSLLTVLETNESLGHPEQYR